MASPRGAVAALVAGLLLAGGLTSCSNSTDSYCSTLKAEKKKLSALAADAGRPGSDAIGRSVGVMSELRDAAPDDISGEWDTLVGALRDLDDAVKASGASYSDFASGKTPAGVSTGQLKAVQQAAAELSSTRVQQAGTSIEQHSLDVCKVDLGGGLGGADGGSD